MLHRAVFGTLERFIGLLIEHYEGKFPFWLAPRQVVVATITSDAEDYAQEVLQALRGAGLRAEADIRNEKINYKVREHSVGKVPVLLVVGRKEADEKTVSIRRLGSKQQVTVGLGQAVTDLRQEALAPDLKPQEMQAAAE